MREGSASTHAHNSIIKQRGHSVKGRLNVSWRHFHSQSGSIKDRFARACGFTRVCFSCYDPMVTLILNDVPGAIAAVRLREGFVNSLWESWQREVTPSLFLTFSIVSGSETWQQAPLLFEGLPFSSDALSSASLSFPGSWFLAIS